MKYQFCDTRLSISRQLFLRSENYDEFFENICSMHTNQTQGKWTSKVDWHQAGINDTDPFIPPLHHLEAAVINSTCMWIQLLLDFTTDTHEEYSTVTFESKKARHVSTKWPQSNANGCQMTKQTHGGNPLSKYTGLLKLRQ